MDWESLKMKNSQLKDRVAHAYYNYGRFCSAHPSSCITMSIITIVLLSSPLVIHLKVGANSPVDIFESNDFHLLHEEQHPEWLSQNPAVYIQHITVHTKAIGDQNSTISQKQVFRELLYSSFTLNRVVSEFAKSEQFGISCFRVVLNGNKQFKGLKTNSCLILSPSLFWSNSETFFSQDTDVRKTILSTYCGPSFCLRDLFMGVPLSTTTIKDDFNNGRNIFNISYGITLFAVRMSNTTVSSLKSWILQKVPLLKLASYNGSSYLHIFYSKLGLALAAVFTVAATSAMTAGICTHYNIMPTLWGAELFLYLALVVGLENTLCLTRSVVYTPPAMDVHSRIAHGLSQEGYSFTKYFVLEMAFLLIGFLTFVPEIQEFCIFGWIGLIIDFYMQLFFYAPCLTFDLLRLDPEEKQRFSFMLFYSGIRQYKNYANPRCPFMRIWPNFFKKTVKLFRDKWESQMQLETEENELKDEGRRRVTSHSLSDNVFPRRFIRVRLLYYWTRTRIVHRAVMVVFVLWTLWIGFIVQDWHLLNFNANKIKSPNTSGTVNNLTIVNENNNEIINSKTEVVEPVSYWMDMRSKMFCWWPSLLGKNKLSVSGRYITILPDIVFYSTIRFSEVKKLVNVGSKVSDLDVTGAQSHLPSEVEYRLMSRIYILETQMAVVLVVSVVFLVTTVGMFLLYESHLKGDSDALIERCTRRIAEPVIFFCFLDSCWQAIRRVDRKIRERKDYCNKTIGEDEKNNELPQIWCMIARQFLLLIGCSDGTLEIAAVDNGSILKIFKKLGKNSGIVQILAPSLRIILLRLDNSIDFLDIKLSPNKACRVEELTSIPPQQTRIVHSVLTLFCLATVSQDRYIQVYGIRSGNLLHTLQAQHNGAIVSVCSDPVINMVYTSCEDGAICTWDLESGKMVRAINGISLTNEVMELGCTPSMLLGYSSDGHLWIWDKYTGQLNTRITPDASLTKKQFGKRCLVVVNNQIIVTSFGDTVLFWDLNYKVVAKQVYIEGPVTKLVSLNNAVLCCVAQCLYRIDVPVMRYG
uniref:Sterol regulatory element-binding protein cleavage-activating protein n=1 Tax=Syphacia muris TaxID=451379 RepID=A0A0N5AXU8_9BILA